MRTVMLMGKMVMNYPDEVVFINDRNVIELASVTATLNPVGGTFSLSNDQKTVQISYESERDTLTFDLYSVLKALSVNNNPVITVSGSVSCGTTTTTITPFTIAVNWGKTLPTRPHCSERIVYFNDISQLIGVEILTMNGGSINGAAVSAGITKLNFNQYGDFKVTVVDGLETRYINFKYVSIGGYADPTGVGCAGGSAGENTSYGYLTVNYINTDGCHRWLCGKIKNRKRSITQSDWRANELIRNTPNAITTGYTDEITVVFPECERLAYVEDIMFSPEIYFINESGVAQPCLITTKTLTLDNWDSNDIEITFKTLA